MKIFDKKIIGLVVGIIFIALILRNIDIHKSIEAVKHLNFLYVILMIPAYYGAFLFRSLRWRAILVRSNDSKQLLSTDTSELVFPAKKEVKLSSFLNSIFRGWFMNFVIPARGGELYRAHYFGKKEGFSRATILASIVLERLFDGIILFLILLTLVSFVYSSKKFFSVAIAAGIIFTGIFIFLFLTSKLHKNNFILKKFERFFTKNNDKEKDFLTKLFDKTTKSINSFMGGLNVFESPVLILKSFFFTLLVWFCEGMTTFLLIKGFGYSIGILGAMFVLSVVAFASLIPGGPAGLGPVQWATIMVLKVFNISQDTAFAVSIISQLFSVVLVSLGSLFFIMTEKLNSKN